MNGFLYGLLLVASVALAVGIWWACFAAGVFGIAYCAWQLRFFRASSITEHENRDKGRSRDLFFRRDITPRQARWLAIPCFVACYALLALLFVPITRINRPGGISRLWKPFGTLYLESLKGWTLLTVDTLICAGAVYAVYRLGEHFQDSHRNYPSATKYCNRSWSEFWYEFSITKSTWISTAAGITYSCIFITWVNVLVSGFHYGPFSQAWTMSAYFETYLYTIGIAVYLIYLTLLAAIIPNAFALLVYLLFKICWGWTTPETVSSKGTRTRLSLYTVLTATAMVGGTYSFLQLVYCYDRERAAKRQADNATMATNFNTTSSSNTTLPSDGPYLNTTPPTDLTSQGPGPLSWSWTCPVESYTLAMYTCLLCAATTAIFFGVRRMWGMYQRQRDVKDLSTVDKGEESELELEMEMEMEMGEQKWTPTLMMD